ncbi:MAG: type II toxin-antitoxin system MqsR family toxin [Nitrospinae bacterium]|nr:type II toxin-antitoxin system MqsR family toxin [Nitrospinota bacterium]
MEKRTSHYNLDELKALIKNENTRTITRTCIKTAHELGFSETEIVDIVFSLTNNSFYKSMTTYGSSKVWQDVYKPCVRGVNLYIKIQKTLDDKCGVISFKKDEKEEDNYV